MYSKKRILIAPLDWGLGHATRCIPIIRQLLLNNAEVILAADKRPLALLRDEFPQLEFVVLPGYNIYYPRKGNLTVSMLWQASKIFTAIYREHKQLKTIIKEKNIDAVISDNRYGLWSKTVPCIFITHQLNIRTPFAGKILHKFNSRFIRKYNECWIPDLEGTPNLSGDLSHKQKLPANTYFIGPLSRFTNVIPVTKKKYDVLAILSGPEPQRSVFENIILNELQAIKLKCLIVQGIPEIKEIKKINDNIEIISHLNSEELNRTICESELIISRPGYSTIMDLAVLGKKAIFIPTPGQTEQEYLAEKFKSERIANSMSQQKFNLKESINKTVNYTGFSVLEIDPSHLTSRIDYITGIRNAEFH
ncbi:MAG: glycosyltransferase [Bacteroidetes bacterium]|nr:glycosyltransferase [Bacteroidota bacterium]